MIRTEQPLSALPAAQVQQLLFVGRGLNFQSTADQALTRVFAGTSYIVTNVIAVRKAGGATVSVLGGIYTAAAKGGSAVVGAVQSWIGLSGAGKATTATLAALALTDVLSSDLTLSLTTGSTGAVTADVFVYGVVVD